MSTGPRKRVSRERRRRLILDAATERFGASGYHQATVANLAEAAGISAPVLYAHFPSKQELYLAVLADQAQALASHLADYLDPALVGLEARLEGTARGVVSFARANPQGWRLLVEPPSGEAELFAAHRRVRRNMAAGARDVTARDPDFTPTPGVSRSHALDLFGELQWAAFECLGRWADANPRLNADGAVAVFMDLVWVGLEQFRAGRHWRPPVS